MMRARSIPADRFDYFIIGAGLNGRSLRYPRGKTLGGSSSINGMIYMRVQARDYDHWASLTRDPAWSWANVLPDFEAHENHYRLDAGEDPAIDGNSRFSDMHGHGGERRIERLRLRWNILDAFSAAAVEAGVPNSTKFNTGDNEGAGYFEVNQKSGWRWNTSKAFLRPARKRTNLVIWTEAQVKRLLFQTAPSDGGPAANPRAMTVGLARRQHLPPGRHHQDGHRRRPDGRGRQPSAGQGRRQDAGVMPTITGGNTNLPTLMIAERAAAMIIQGA